jgi:hypothetical protein
MSIISIVKLSPIAYENETVGLQPKTELLDTLQIYERA